MFFFTAERIHDGNNWLPTGTTIELNEDGTIIAIHDFPVHDAVFYEGVLTPGFVNVHGHLELSHMKGVIPERTGLIPFLKSIISLRDEYSAEQKKDARFAAYIEMLDNGIVATGDIANTTDALDVRALDKMHFHTFIEAMGFSELSAARSFGHALQHFHSFTAQVSPQVKLLQSITPHAPYSVSKALFQLIDRHSPGAVLSIHNQETREENKYYIKKKGSITELLDMLGIDDSYFEPTGKSSIRSYLNWLSSDHAYIFVHNTYTTLEDVQYVNTHLRNVYWCLCPGANLYIENTLPDVEMFVEEDIKICIGTDSLASNHQLSVLAELRILKENFPNLSWETLLRWGTRNGAFALQLGNKVGTIAPGRKPGILQIKGITESAGIPEMMRII